MTDYAAHVLAHIDVTDSGCWRFTGYVLPQGYGQVGRNLRTHRVVWEHLRGPIPSGMYLDHECHNRDLTCAGGDRCLHRRCVNPAHLAVVTPRGNALSGRAPSAINATKTHCPEGHEYTPENTYERPDRFGRLCRICRHDIAVRFGVENREHVNALMRQYRADNRELFRAYNRERYRLKRLGISTKGVFAEMHAGIYVPRTRERIAA